MAISYKKPFFKFLLTLITHTNNVSLLSAF